MENYNLKENETVLYRGDVNVIADGKQVNSKIPTSELWLTNLNIVICTPKKKLLKTVYETKYYSVSDVKNYDEKVQVIKRKNIVDIYLKEKELFLHFAKEKEARLFCDIALKLMSGDSKFVRSVKRIKKEIRETDEALDINIEGMVAATATFAAETLVGVSSLEGAGKKSKTFGVIADKLLHSKRKNQPKEIVKDNLPEEEN